MGLYTSKLCGLVSSSESRETERGEELGDREAFVSHSDKRPKEKMDL